MARVDPRGPRELNAIIEEKLSPTRGRSFVVPTTNRGFAPAPAVPETHKRTYSASRSRIYDSVRYLDATASSLGTNRSRPNSARTRSAQATPRGQTPRGQGTPRGQTPGVGSQATPRGQPSPSAGRQNSQPGTARSDRGAPRSHSAGGTTSRGNSVNTRSSSQERKAALAPITIGPSLALAIVRDVTQRKTDIHEVRQELERARMQRILNMRYNMVVNEEETFLTGSDERPEKFIRAVPKHGYRIEYYSTGRKMTMYEFQKRRVVDPEKVAKVASRQESPKGAITQTNIDTLVGLLGNNGDVLAKLALVNKAFAHAVELHIAKENAEVASLSEVTATLRAAREGLRKIPLSFFNSFRTIKGNPPTRIMFVLKLVVLILEKSAQLSANPTFDGPSATALFRSYLTEGSEHAVAIMEAEDPMTLPKDVVESIDRAIAKEQRDLGCDRLEPLVKMVKSYNDHAFKLLQWCLALVNYYKEATMLGEGEQEEQQQQQQQQ